MEYKPRTYIYISSMVIVCTDYKYIKIKTLKSKVICNYEYDL